MRQAARRCFSVVARTWRELIVEERLSGTGWTYDYHGHDGCHYEAEVDLHVGEHDEPPVARSRFQFAS